jgi:hypothetical protein
MTDDDERAAQAFRAAFATRADDFAPETLSGEPIRRPRRAWPAVLLAAAAVLVLTIGTLVWQQTRGTDHRASAPAASGLPDDWRWESHADVEVAVPDSWGYRATPGSDWCAAYDQQGKPQDGGAAFPHTPYVDTVSGLGATLGIGCFAPKPSSLLATHLTFVDSPDLRAEPPGALSGFTTITRAVGSTHVDVTTDSAHEDLARQILATAHVVSADQNGCPASSPIQASHAVRPDPTFDVTALTGVDSIAVCQYLTHGTGQPGLLASRLLTGSAADAELTALQAAPAGGGPDQPQNCTPDGWGDTAVVLRLTTGGQTHDMYGYYEWCFGNGFDDGTSVRELTPADCSSLWADRVQLLGGSSAPFHRCQPSVRY